MKEGSLESAPLTRAAWMAPPNRPAAFIRSYARGGAINTALNQLTPRPFAILGKGNHRCARIEHGHHILFAVPRLAAVRQFPFQLLESFRQQRSDIVLRLAAESGEVIPHVLAAKD